MMNAIIEIGKITIIHRPEEKMNGHEELETYDIFIEGTQFEKRPRQVHTSDIRLVVLEALQLQAHGLNSQFVFFASKMLEIDGELWT